VGVLTDRYGARVMFPAVSLAAAASMFGLGFANSLPAAVIAGGAAGVAGAAFVVGASLVSRVFPYGRRGLALGVFNVGTVFAAAISGAVWQAEAGARPVAQVLGVALVAFAALAGLVLRDPAAAPRASPFRRCVEMIRLASTTSLSLLYALALGGVLAIAVYIPVYLTRAHDLEVRQVVPVGGALVALAALARLAGGWWTDRRPTAGLLVVCYATAAGLCLVLAVTPPSWPVSAHALAGIAACDGLASGALLALIGKAARPDSVGAVMGVTSAVGALGGLLPPLVLAGVDLLTRSYTMGWTLLAMALAGVAIYVRARGLRIGLGLAVRPEPTGGPTAMTIAVVGHRDAGLGAAAVVARLAELAASDELVVVCGSDEQARPPLTAHTLVVGLRDRLPRHSVAAVRIAAVAGILERDAVLLNEFVEVGAVAVAFTPTTELRGVAAKLSSYLRADRVLRVSFSLADGAHVHQVWKRGAAGNR
jgi:NNP family nitrate/nitrite transporter-like MFS transporter